MARELAARQGRRLVPGAHGVRTPRARGRSIIGDARSPKMQSVMNLKIKYRESFRPFAPSVLRERVADYFEMDRDSPYMLLVAPVVEKRRTPMTAEHESLWGIELLNVPRSDIPAVTHVDYSARIQTVHQATNPRYYAAAQGLRGEDRLRRDREHLVQRARRADRLHARGRLPVLHAHGDGRAGPGELRPREGAQKPLADDSDWSKEFELD